MSQSGGDVYLLDYSRESLRLAHTYMKDEGVKLILADARSCPFSNNSFDVVFHQGLLEHFTSPFYLLRENHRILKKGGLLIVDVPQTFHVYTIMKHILLRFGLWFGGWERQFTVRSLATLLRKMKFQPVHHYGDWSRPGIFYKIVRQIASEGGIKLPMYPKFLGSLTEKFYRLQHRLRRKRLFLYTVLSIGIIAKKT